MCFFPVLLPWSSLRGTGNVSRRVLRHADSPWRYCNLPGDRAALPTWMTPCLSTKHYTSFQHTEQRVCRPPVCLFHAECRTEFPLSRSCPLYAEIKCGPELSLLIDLLGVRGRIPRLYFYFPCFLFSCAIPDKLSLFTFLK